MSLPLPLLAFILPFYLFAASGGLTYLSLRSWLHAASRRSPSRSLWRESHVIYAGRAFGFGTITVASLVGGVNDAGQGPHGVDLVSLSRLAGYLLVFATTPPRLRRRPIVGLAIILPLIAQFIQVLYAGGGYAGITPQAGAGLILVTMLATDIGITLLAHCYTRTVLRVRITDKFMLAFALFSLLLILVATIVTAYVVRISFPDTMGPEIAQTIQNLDRTLIIMLVAIVVASAVISFFVARSLSAPVNRMALALRAIGRGDLDLRLHGIRSRDEMQDLANEINEMARRLKEADSVRAEFVSFASHELRNPLTAVKGFIDTLSAYDKADAGGLSEEERHEMYDTIRGECDRLLRMTNELLDSSRAEAGLPVAIHVELFDVRREIAKVVEIMRTHTQRHELTIVVPDRPLTIDGDVDKFDQILINLLSNAIKYSPRGGPIEVTAEDRGTTIDVSVKDQGMGMSAEQAERVFDKYYRIQDTAGRRRQPMAVGTGIGLYLTRALVNAHGGTIRVRSVPEEGSVFTVTLPKRQPSTDRTTEPGASNSVVPIASV